MFSIIRFGVLREIARILTPGGILILTTPNPSTAINAMRVLLDRHSLWGTAELIRNKKVRGGEFVFAGGIHYREYRRAELVDALRECGFSIVKATYQGIGSSAAQPLLKRALKSVGQNTFMRIRLFGSVHYLVAGRDR